MLRDAHAELRRSAQSERRGDGSAQSERRGDGSAQSGSAAPAAAPAERGEQEEEEAVAAAAADLTLALGGGGGGWLAELALPAVELAWGLCGPPTLQVTTRRLGASSKNNIRLSLC